MEIIRLAKKYILPFIGYGGATASLIYLIFKFFGQIEPETKTIISLFFLLALYIIIDNVFLRYKWWRKQKYTSVFKDINRGFAKLHELARLDNPNPESIHNNLRNTCNSLSDVFSKVSEKECGVCIKILGQNEEDDDLIVKTLCRDKQSRHRNQDSGYVHKVSDNTDFDNIIKNAEAPGNRYYFNNYLPFSWTYKNSRFEQANISEPQNYFEAFKNWPLDYKSTIVVPICPGLDKPIKSTLIAGFLCVDSNSYSAFTKVDLEVLRGVADGLYNTIDSMYDTLTQDMAIEVQEDANLEE